MSDTYGSNAVNVQCNQLSHTGRDASSLYNEIICYVRVFLFIFPAVKVHVIIALAFNSSKGFS